MEVAGDAQFCVKLLYDKFGSLKVPMYNVILSILPTISVMVLLKLLDIAIEQSQPELSRTSARAVFKDRVQSVGTARRRKKRTCCAALKAPTKVMLPQYFSIARLLTMFDFVMVIWLLMAAKPTELWFQLLTIALRFAYGFVEFMIPVVLCATAIRYTDNPSRIEFDLRRAYNVAFALAGTEALVQLILIAVYHDGVYGFIPEAVLITCTPPPSNTGQITDEFIYRIADTGGSLVFWFVRDFADLVYFSAFLVYYWGHHKGFTYVTKDRRSAPGNTQAPNHDVPVVSDTGYGSQAPGRNNHTKSSLLSPPKSSPGTRAPAKPRRSLSLCPHPRPSVVFYAGFLTLVRFLRVLACLVGFAGQASSPYLCIFALAYFLENGLLPAVAYLSLTYDSDFCRNQGFGDGTMMWRAGRGTVSEQDYNSVVLIEKLHHAGSRSLWEGVWNGASVAVKRWRYPSKKNLSRAAEARRKHVATEIRLMRTLVHPNIVQFLCYCVDVPVDEKGRVVPRSRDLLDAPAFRDARIQSLSANIAASVAPPKDLSLVMESPSHISATHSAHHDTRRRRIASSPAHRASSSRPAMSPRAAGAQDTDDAVVAATDGAALVDADEVAELKTPGMGVLSAGAGAGAGAGGGARAGGRASVDGSSAGVDSGSLRDSALGEAGIRLTISTGGGGSARRNSSQSSADFSRAYASGVATPNPSRREVWIVMELLDQLNLHKLVKSEPELFDSPRVVLSVASQLCAACCYLRENDIIHRDIKTPNILVRRSANGQLHIKLADFDAAIRLPRDGVVKDKDDTSVRGTYLWMAPEVFHDQTYSESSDVFAFGIVLYELLMKTTPYKGLTLKTPHHFSCLLMPSTNMYTRYIKPTRGPKPLRQLVIRCTDPRPDHRPSFAYISAVLADGMRGLASAESVISSRDSVTPRNASVGRHGASSLGSLGSERGRVVSPRGVQ